MISSIQRIIGVKFAERSVPGVSFMKLGTLEIEISIHPWIHYTAIRFCNQAVAQLLSVKGFTRVERGKNFSYYISRPTSHMEVTEPIVFFHGLGVGLLAYINMIIKLCSKYSDRPIIIFDIAHISTSAQTSSRDSMLSHGFVRELMKSLELESLPPKMHILAHSIGTIYVAWILKYAGADAISSAVFIDPVCFRLINPKLTYHFLRRTPRTAFEHLIHLFVSSELYQASFIHRSFVWHENSLFADEIDEIKDKMAVFLAEHDNLIDTHDIAENLRKKNAGVKLYVGPFDHGQMIVTAHEEIFTVLDGLIIRKK
jgi:pimeloyl-ACP methyl ester carboxylesterase